MRHTRHIHTPLLTALAVIIGIGISSCRRHEFKIDGTIEGGAGKTMALEKADFHGRWYPVDSIHIKKNGSFSVSAEAPSSPEIYRLALDGRYIYLPVDSTESLRITSDAASFGSKFTLTGTPQAERMARFESELINTRHDIPDSLEAFKRRAYEKYLRDARGAIMSYYVLTKTINGKPLYNPADNADIKYYAAVATAFDQYRPDDPHTKMLHNVSVEAMQRRNAEAGRRHVIEAAEVSVIDIELTDEKDVVRRLSDFTGNGKKTLLVVSMMNRSESPAFNVALSEIWQRHSGDLNIYHVSLDEDRYEWRDAARNLPWTTVFDAGGRQSDILRRYNIGVIPVFFIYDRNGELTARADSFDELSKLL